MIGRLLAGIGLAALLCGTVAAQNGTVFGPAGVSGCANPTGTVGLTAVNGTATTCQRSDAAPPLSQAITPTWTGAHIFSVSGAASTPGLSVTGIPFAGTGTTSTPQLFVQPSNSTVSSTWNTSGTAFGVNAHTGIGLLTDLQLDGSSKFMVDFNGGMTAAGSILLGSASRLQFSSRGIFSSPAAGQIQLGNTDAAAPVAQTLSVQSVVAGTSNTAGQNATIIGSLSTGAGTSGDIIVKTGGTGAGAAVQNSSVTAITIKGATQLVQLNAITSDATRTDSTVCQDTTTHALYAGSGTIGICLGTSSARFKHDIAPLGYGLGAILGLRPISYYLNADHGDPTHQLFGFTAEDMKPVVPELVGLDATGKPNTADYVGLIPVLVRAVQEQQAEIEILKSQLAARPVLASNVLQ